MAKATAALSPIRQLRTACGLTQQAFADYFGIPKRTIENWEGGQNSCPEYLISLIRYKLETENKIKAGE